MHTPFMFKSLVMSHAALWGNHYSIIVRDGMGTPIELLPVHPRSVEVTKLDNELFYHIKMDNEKMTFASENILHIQGMGYDGVKGKSVISTHAENFGLSLSSQKYGKEFYDKGTKLDGYIKMTGKLDPTQIKKLRESWGNTYGGVSGSKTAVLDAGAEYKSLGLPPEDAQYLGTRRFQKNEIATIFRIPAHMVNEMERATHSNIEHQAIEFVMYSLMPWVQKFEEECTRKLTTEAEFQGGNISIKMNANALLRGDASARADFYFKMEQMGVMSINEIRRLENLNPIADGGQHFVPLNRIALSQANEFYSKQQDNGE